MVFEPFVLQEWWPTRQLSYTRLGMWDDIRFVLWPDVAAVASHWQTIEVDRDTVRALWNRDGAYAAERGAIV